MNCRKTLKKFPINFRKNRKIFVILSLLLISAVFIPNFEVAVGGIVVCQTAVCSWTDFVSTLANLLKELVSFAFWVAVLLSVIGAFIMMFGGAKADNYQKGKSMIMIAIIGYSLILLSGIIFDVILDFFQPQFHSLSIKFTLAASSDLTPGTYFDPLKRMLTSGLRCGTTTTSSIDRIISCAFEAIGALSSLAVILLGVAIFASAAYLISTPLFGLANIPKAWQILIWSIIGLIIILLANIIKDQIIRLTTFNNNFSYFVFAQVKPGEVIVTSVPKIVRVCPPSIFRATTADCTYPSIQEIASSVVMFIIDRLAPPLLVLLIIIGGFFYLLSPFDIKSIQTGHNYIKWAVYGYFILLIIVAILSVISAFLGGPSSP